MNYSNLITDFKTQPLSLPLSLGNCLTNTNYQSIPTNFLTPIKTTRMQVKLAIFKVERDEKGDVKSSKFLKEFWTEKLPNVSIELLAVKELESGFEPNDIVVREIQSVYL